MGNFDRKMVSRLWYPSDAFFCDIQSQVYFIFGKVSMALKIKTNNLKLKGEAIGVQLPKTKLVISVHSRLKT